MKFPKLKRVYFVLPCFISLTFIASSCTKKSRQNTLEITGSSTVAPLVAEIAKKFEEENPNTRINVQTGGSSRGISDIRKGISHIGMVSRALNDSEKDLQNYVIAKDGIGIITHAALTSQDFSSREIKDIFTGKTAHWKTKKGDHTKITVIHKAQGRSTSELFIKHFSLQYNDVNAHIIIGDNEQGIKNVSTIPGAIGYVSIGAAETAIRNQVPIKLVSLDGIHPSSKNVSNGTYAILRPLNLVTKDNSNPLAETFIKFAQSQNVSSIVRKLDFVPQQQRSEI